MIDKYRERLFILDKIKHVIFLKQAITKFMKISL